MGRRREDVQYLPVDMAIEKVMEARAYQRSQWPSLVEPDRTVEEWILLTSRYVRKLEDVYSETPSYKNDGRELNLEGLARIEKYAAIVANLALWAVQAAKGIDAKLPQLTGCTFHTSQNCLDCEPGLDPASQGKDSINT